MAAKTTGRRWSFKTRQPDNSFIERFAIDPDGAIVNGTLTLTDEVATGASTLDLGTNAPTHVTPTTPYKYVSLMIDGQQYCFPVWRIHVDTSGPPLAGLQLWVKGDAGITLSGSQISAWADQSGNGNDLTQSNPSWYPDYSSGGIAGVPCAVFGTGSLALENASFPWGPSFSVAVVFQRNGAGSGGRLVDWYYSTKNKYIWSSSTVHFEDDDQSIVINGNTGLAPAVTSKFLLTVGAGTGTVYQDDLSTAVNSAALTETSTTGIRFGSLPSFGQGSDCTSPELLIWDHVLDSTERTQLATYLTARGY